jgi:hypothetical protein
LTWISERESANEIDDRQAKLLERATTRPADPAHEQVVKLFRKWKNNAPQLLRSLKRACDAV